MQKGIRLNDGHVTYLGLLAKKDGTRRGCLSKKSSDNTKWHTKWFALLQNMLFYFENESSSRPSGLYLLEGCICDRAPSPKPSQSAKECLEKQVWRESARARTHTHTHTHTRRQALFSPLSLTHTHTHTHTLCCFIVFRGFMLKYWRGASLDVTVPFSLRLVWNLSFTHVPPPHHPAWWPQNPAQQSSTRFHIAVLLSLCNPYMALMMR